MEEMTARQGRFGTTARLFTLVEELPRDRQLILLKQLLGERITNHLCKLIIEMADDQLQHFLSRLDSMSAHVAECGELFGAMGGLADADIDRLLVRLEHWRRVAPRWSGWPGARRRPPG